MERIVNEKRLHRYAGKLLFSYQEDGVGGTTCESRVVVVKAECADSALRHLKAKGIASQGASARPNENGNMVRYLFVGVMELLDLDLVFESEDEVWYDIFGETAPNSLVPAESELSAISGER